MCNFEVRTAFIYFSLNQSNRLKFLTTILAKLLKLRNLNAYKRVVIMCTTEETGKYISNTLSGNLFENILNQSKTQIISKEIR